MLIGASIAAIVFVALLAFILTRGKAATKDMQNDNYGYTTDNSSDTPSDTNSQNQQTTNRTVAGAPIGGKILDKPTEITIDTNKNYRAILRTSKGDITIDLNEKATPITVNNFVYLAEQDYYDGVIFHRVIKDFMIQSGDPTGTGAGTPGYRFDDEPFEGDYERGVVAMANAGPNTNGSQFFIMHQYTPLPKNYVIFGNVISGLETIDAIANQEVQMSGNGEMSSPIEPTVINEVVIESE